MNKNVRIALLFLGLLFVWFLSGFVSDTQKKEQTSKKKAVSQSVQALNLKGQMYSPQLILKANTEAFRELKLISQVSGKIREIYVTEGSVIDSGETVCEVDAEDKFSKLDSAKATLEESKLIYEGAIELDQKGYQSDLAISQAKSNLLRAQANVDRLSLDIGNLNITAPFRAFVEEIPVEIGQVVSVGMLCASLVELNPIKIVADVDFDDIHNIKLDSKVVYKTDNSPPRAAEILFISKKANEFTGSFKIEALVENPAMDILAGLPARLFISMEETLAHLVPASSILLSDNGNTIVKVVKNGIVNSKEVSVLGESESGFWISGLPSEISVITVGQNYVVTGDHVNVNITNN